MKNVACGLKNVHIYINAYKLELIINKISLVVRFFVVVSVHLDLST